MNLVLRTAAPSATLVAGVKQAEALLSGLENQRIMIVGAGATSEQVVKHLCDRGVPQNVLWSKPE